MLDGCVVVVDSWRPQGRNGPECAEGRGARRIGAFGTVSPLRTPRIQYYNATIQHELFPNNVLTVSYVGAHGTNMLLNRQLNLRPIGCWDDNNPDNPGQQKGPAGTIFNTTTLNCSRQIGRAHV